MPESTVIVLHAAGVLDVDPGEVIDGGDVGIEGRPHHRGRHRRVDRRRRRPGDRPARPHPRPRPHGHGGRPRARRSRRRTERPGADGPGEDGPASGRQRAADPARRVHDGAQPRPVHQDRRLPASTSPSPMPSTPAGSKDRGSIPAGPRHLPDRRPPRPERAERPGSGHHADDRRGGHRRRDRRGPQGRPLPDHPRRQAHQVLRVGRRDDTRPALRARSSTPPRSSPRSPTRPTVAASGSPPTPTATRPSTPRIDAGIDCIEHGMMIGDDTIQRLVDTGTFLVSTCALTENWDISEPAQVAPGQGGRGLPQGQGVAVARRSRPA